jgi:hypothetical protein
MDRADHPTEHECLETMMATLAEFSERAFFVDDHGYLEIDDRRYAEIARRNNPAVVLWSGA